MHLSFLEYLADPQTHEPLTLTASRRDGDFVERGSLHSSTGTYPIVDGVPRFVGPAGNYSRSFGYQWHKWPRVQFESQNVGRPMQGHTRQMWERITGLSPLDDLNGSVVLDMGCGAGRFTDVARAKGARVIGVDFSSAADVAAANFAGDPNVCICQADALRLPLRPNSLDGAFSIGVLHHTPDPKSGIAQAFNVLRRGGWFAVAVYGKGGYYDFPSVQAWRKLFKALWPICRHYPPLAYSYFASYALRPVARALPPLGRAIRAFFPFINLPDATWSLLDTFDSVTPSYQSAHDSYEVFDWLRTAGFNSVEPTNWGFTSYRGTRPASHPSPPHSIAKQRAKGLEPSTSSLGS